MSASAVPQLQVVHTGIRGNWAQVKPAFMRGLAPRLESYVAIVCFGIVNAMTIGLGRTWAKIGWAYFLKVVGGNGCRRSCEKAIDQLIQDGLIRRRKAEVGTGWEYALAVRSTGTFDPKLAACRTCKRTDDMEVDVDFIPVPHSFFRDLPATCDRGMYLIMMAVIVRTMRMQDKEIVSIPCEITVDEFRQATGLERSEILDDLQKLQAEGFDVLGSEHRGRYVAYWTKPENFAKGQPRAPRKLNRQANKEKKSKAETAPKVEQPTETKQTIRPVEFVTLPCGYCRHCNTYGPVDLVQDDQKKPLGSANRTDYVARAGPIGQPLASWPSYKVPNWKKEA